MFLFLCDHREAPSEKKKVRIGFNVVINCRAGRYRLIRLERDVQGRDSGHAISFEDGHQECDYKKSDNDRHDQHQQRLKKFDQQVDPQL